MRTTLRLHIIKDGEQDNQFMILFDPSSSISLLKEKVQETYKSLYPFESNINIRNIKNEESYDIPNEYLVGEIFPTNSKVIVESFSSPLKKLDGTMINFKEKNIQHDLDGVENDFATVQSASNGVHAINGKRTHPDESENPRKLPKKNFVEAIDANSPGFVYRPTSIRDRAYSISSNHDNESTLTEGIALKEIESPDKDRKADGIVNLSVTQEEDDNHQSFNSSLTPSQPTTYNRANFFSINDASSDSSSDAPLRTLSSPSRLRMKDNDRKYLVEHSPAALIKESETIDGIDDKSLRSSTREVSVESPNEDSVNDDSSSDVSDEKETEAKHEIRAPAIIVRETSSHPSTAVPSENDTTESENDTLSESSTTSISSSPSENSDTSDDLTKVDSPNKSLVNDNVSAKHDKESENGKSKFPPPSQTLVTTSTISAAGNEPSDEIGSENDSDSDSDSDSSVPLSQLQKKSQQRNSVSHEIQNRGTKGSPKEPKAKPSTERPETHRTLSYSRLSELSKTFSPEIREPSLTKKTAVSMQESKEEGRSDESSESEESGSSSDESDNSEKEDRSNPIPVEKRASTVLNTKKKRKAKRNSALAGLAALV
ncbi:Nucleolar protein dnt1 [Schizosaccharomyces pombe]|uniref:Nucleolar protein dnt1 n=1 Tax=Schizosaccharomyces pombe (strain 972 / ATCC 24843) TaxID=284812 RepID=DNT1_SCHPO|nr:nucleolar protein Dnt1 [Schizosaccharomyces pombe]O74354.1 RecName: Full=Nucleolar protein dnt1 [Schizosaccharomyces pombe 972h-]CAA20098.1 nucleolar protein Dnt1 [Schizosaccharomyces pombe]|eukprot:NP_596544.1 nucleolar protein Dnt1 [Schizosaccharomyces pombe]